MVRQVYFKYFVHPESEIRPIDGVEIVRGPCLSHLYNNLPILIGYESETNRIFLAQNVESKKVKNFISKII